MWFSCSIFSYFWPNVFAHGLWPHYTGQVQIWLLCLIQFMRYKLVYSSWKQGHQYPIDEFFHFAPRKMDLWYILRLSLYSRKYSNQNIVELNAKTSYKTLLQIHVTISRIILNINIRTPSFWSMYYDTQYKGLYYSLSL